MAGYTAVTAEDLAIMLDAIGVGSIEELFDAIPAGVRLERPIDLPPGEPEQAVYAELRRLAERNVCAEDEITFLGAGMYDHYVPSIVDMLMSRSEFLTPYTPYQPEISQGRLEALLNFQTMVEDLTGLPVAGASLLDEATAAAEAMTLARRTSKAGSRAVFLVDADAHPQTVAVLRTRAEPLGLPVQLHDMCTDLPDDIELFGVLLQYPGSGGAVRDLGPVVQ
ncbi:MAG: glycine dehydrogenase (aminomethyl-transferring), partial [Actinobacteria bacterium]|nr:glycine dehydrogenase (aminomethyl-transferring) [Actinomycetota bacterium]